MPPSNAERPAAAVTANGPLKSDPLPREISPTVNRLLAHYQEARRRLERRIDDLDTIADWKRDLQERIARAQLVFEIVDVDVDMDGLAGEVSDFKTVCHAIAGRSPYAEAGS
jgi:hypothetical protein